MASLGAVHSMGESIIGHLRDAHQLQRQVEEGVPPEARILPDCAFRQLAGSDLAAEFTPNGNEVTLYLYRIGMDKLLRTAPDPRTPNISASRPLSLELHYLLTSWSTSAADEHTLMSWAMRELHMRPIFDRSRLLPPELWQMEETVQVTPSELKHEDMMRVWDALAPAYRLSVSYIARAVRVETVLQPAAGPVAATRFQIEELRSLASGAADDA
ncbi:DUF4255 domain-containing protein [Poseidonocella sp. HB161398]|uniref:DUF4255 domain-containing protein n=1 Tax=Poseidonocella sp. HB161398 TaxID=2320855 RepID=UPI001485CE62|nr:DUF4255 domain-containing protein [Poseidonocella sp. HB161398]